WSHSAPGLPGVPGWSGIRYQLLKKKVSGFHWRGCSVHVFSVQILVVGSGIVILRERLAET
ncbi:MAG: hypothetical protein MUD09_09480, partial [Desulfobacterales bacterium]|nr:hypothetical protein [Desulfobacterales bacterium]